MSQPQGSPDTGEGEGKGALEELPLFDGVQVYRDGQVGVQHEIQFGKGSTKNWFCGASSCTEPRACYVVRYVIRYPAT